MKKNVEKTNGMNTVCFYIRLKNCNKSIGTSRGGLTIQKKSSRLRYCLVRLKSNETRIAVNDLVKRWVLSIVPS